MGPFVMYVEPQGRAPHDFAPNWLLRCPAVDPYTRPTPDNDDPKPPENSTRTIEEPKTTNTNDGNSKSLGRLGQVF